MKKAILAIVISVSLFAGETEVNNTAEANATVVETNATAAVQQPADNGPGLGTKVLAAVATPVVIAGGIVSFAIMSPFVIGKMALEKLSGTSDK